MSDSPDHPHPHPGDQPAPTPSSPQPEGADDAGTRALSDALRASFNIIRVVMVVLVLVFLGSGFFTVGTQEMAIILRLGKPVGTDERALLGPGPHWAWPYPIDEVVKIPLGEVQTVRSTIGWYATNPALEAAGREPPPGPSLNPAVESYLLTADENVVHTRGILRYRIEPPGLQYTFDFVTASNSVVEAFNNAIIFAASRYKVDNLLTRDAAGFREVVRARLEELITQQRLGILVDQIDLPSIPPRYLAKAFDAVTDAEINRSKVLNQARSYATESVSRAKGQAAALVNVGENRRKSLVEFVASEATNFMALLPAYERNPDLFMRQRQSEALQRILATSDLKMIVPGSSGGKPVELRLQVNKPPQLRAPAPPPAPAEDKH